MGRSTAGRTGPGVLGRVLRIGALVAAAAAPLVAMLVLFAVSAPDGGPVPGPLPPGAGAGACPRAASAGRARRPRDGPRGWQWPGVSPGVPLLALLLAVVA